MRLRINQLNNEIGDLALLNTTSDSDIVQAINAADLRVDSADSYFKTRIASEVATLNTTISNGDSDLNARVDSADSYFKARIVSEVATLNTTISNGDSDLNARVDSADGYFKTRIASEVATLNTTISNGDSDLNARVDSADSYFKTRIASEVATLNSSIDSADSYFKTRIASEVATLNTTISNVDSDLGNRLSLNATNKSSVVAAYNELRLRVDAIDSAAALDLDSAFGLINTIEGRLDSNDTNFVSRTRGSISVSGDLTYSPSTGIISLDVEQVYTKANFDSDLNLALSTDAVTTTDLTEGSNQYYTDSRARSAISVSAGTGLSYSSATGVLSGVNATTATKGVASFNSASFSTSSGAISIKAGGVSNAQLANSSVTVNGTSISLGSSGTLVTDDIAEDGAPTNLWFTNARARSAVSVTDTGGDGSLSYSSATGVFTYTGPSASEVRAHFSAGEGIDITSGVISGENASTANKGIASFDSASFSTLSGAVSIKAGGVSNTQLANSSVTVNGTAISLGSSGTLVTDDIAEDASPTNLWFTNARARSAVSVTDAGGDGSLSYSSATGVFTYTGPSATEVRAHFSAGEGIDITSGVISGEDASTTNKGIASFNSASFSTSAGAVSIKSGGVSNAQLANSSITINGSAVSLGSSISVGSSVADDTTTNATRYLTWTDQTTGEEDTLGVSSTKLYFNPSTGQLNATDFNSLSDATMKEDIQPLSNSIDVLRQINPVKFNWKDNGKTAYGVVAQQIQQVLPDLVSENDKGVLSVAYSQLIAFLVDAVKSQQQEIDSLKDKMEK